MNKVSLKAKILTGVLAGGVLLSSATMAFADTINNSKINEKKIGSKIEFRAPMNKQKFSEEKHVEMEKTLEAVLKDAVTSKTITQDESTTVLEYAANKAEEAKKSKQEMLEKIKNMTEEELKEYKDSFKKDINKKNINKKNIKSKKQHKLNLFDELVKEGTLTKEKADILKGKMKEKMQTIKDAALKEKFDKLVAEGTITKDQSDKIISAIKESQNTLKASFEKMKDMTKEDGKEYMKSIKKQYKNPIKSLVDDGTITEDQAKALKKSSPKKLHGNHKVKGQQKIAK